MPTTDVAITNIAEQILGFVKPVFNGFTSFFLHARFFIIVNEAQFDGWIIFEFEFFHNASN